MYRNKCTTGSSEDGDGDDIMITKDELLNLLPDFFKNVLEMSETMAAYAKALDDAEKAIGRLWDNQYVQTCDEATIALYEQLLKLTYNVGDSLEVRRNRVMNRLLLVYPYSERLVRSRLDELFEDYELTVDSQTSSATMVIKSFTEQGVKLFLELWYGVAPAHIDINVYEDIVRKITGPLYFGGSVSTLVYRNI